MNFGNNPYRGLLVFTLVGFGLLILGFLLYLTAQQTGILSHVPGIGVPNVQATFNYVSTVIGGGTPPAK